ncbi:unnamed protein product [Didymodactylos carnosus]|uniref:Uncharacterized protein n=1 Tax=Didymodactylos carnosus TaxID=1234261 RepID=A0A814PD76_9BILA|nr:unnamed protein product [Didymodactylos carnosus]CAF1103686.1 unnamed protein product [Didymodactylos carnosus]CAF3578745.1 unnamed protein product [Didymodactylos carnosus]CAF3868453.1 unnamed protein product [Didymodactylos carnosus]
MILSSHRFLTLACCGRNLRNILEQYQELTSVILNYLNRLTIYDMNHCFLCDQHYDNTDEETKNFEYLLSVVRPRGRRQDLVKMINEVGINICNKKFINAFKLKFKSSIAEKRLSTMKHMDE